MIMTVHLISFWRGCVIDKNKTFSLWIHVELLEIIQAIPQNGVKPIGFDGFDMTRQAKVQYYSLVFLEKAIAAIGKRWWILSDVLAFK